MPLESEQQRAESETLRRLREIIDLLAHSHEMQHKLSDKLDALDKKQDRLLLTVDGLKETFMATQAELTDQVKAIGDTLTKIGAETSTLLAKMDELKALIAAGGTVTPELQAAVDAVAAQAHVIDDLVPDVPPTVAAKK